MSNPGPSAKTPLQTEKREDLAAEKLFSEYAKTEESDPSEKDHLFIRKMDEALMSPVEMEQRPSPASIHDPWREGQEVAYQAAEEGRFVKTLLEEMSGLEADHEQFEASAKVLRENLDPHAGEGTSSRE